MLARAWNPVPHVAIAILVAALPGCGGDEFASSAPATNDAAADVQDAAQETSAAPDAMGDTMEVSAPLDSAPLDGPEAEAEVGPPPKAGVGQPCNTHDDCSGGAECTGDRCALSLDFEDGDLDGWTTSEPGADGGNASQVGIDEQSLLLRVYKCNDAAASHDVPPPTTPTTVTVRFDWKADAESVWWENPGWRLVSNGVEVAGGELQPSQAVHPNTGQVQQSAQVAGKSTIEFFIHKDKNCFQPDHSYTWLRIDNVRIE